MKSALIRGEICACVLLVMAGCGGGDESGGVGGPPMPIPTASFAVASSTVSEGGAIEVQVTLSSPAPGTVVIPFTTTGTAMNRSDYTTAATPLRITRGNSSGTIYIAATDDLGDEAEESIILSMGEPTHATLGAISSTTILITDTDVPTVAGRVTDSVTGAGIAGVTVRVGSTSTTTDGNGQYVLAGFPSAPASVVSFEAGGYAPQGRFVDSVVMANAAINVPMVQIATTQSFLPTEQIVVAVPNSSAQVVVPANSLRTAAGQVPTGQVTAEVAPILLASNVDAAPGDYIVEIGGGTSALPFEAYGGLYVRFTDANDAVLQLASGQEATLRIPASTRASSLLPGTPLFYYDETAGIWRHEGTATLFGTAPNQYYEGTVTHFSTWNADLAYSTGVDVTGCVQDAVGTRLPEAVVTVEGTSYSSKLTTVTDASGNFTLSVPRNSAAFLQATKGGAVSNSPDIETTTASLNVTPCLVLSANNVSIKLTWGENPEDLDSHTLGPNSDTHISYMGLGSLTEQPYIALDVDDVTGFGPEVTTFTRLARNRRYSFYVHNFSRTFDPGQTGSPARVEITIGGSQRVFSPPAGENNAMLYWHVFDVTTNQACAPTVVPVQRFRNDEPPNQNVGNDAAYCE